MKFMFYNLFYSFLTKKKIIKHIYFIHFLGAIFEDKMF